ncbi:MAG: hypothetical protein ABR601_07830 [Parasphingopyxis sp.]
MNLRALLALLLPAFATMPAAAQEALPFELAAGELRVIHLWTTDAEGFVEAWAQPTPPTLEIGNSTIRNQPIQQFILYASCTRDEQGRCHLTARVTITAPDGTPYGEPMEFEALPLGPTAPAGAIGMAPHSIGLTIEDGEQLGTYRVELTITDEIGGVSASNVAEIEVTESSEPTS